MTPEQQKLREAVAKIARDGFHDKAMTPENIADAVIALVLAEAAKVAEEEAGHCEDTGSAPSDFANEGRNDAARTIAAAIRASIPLSQEPT